MALSVSRPKELKTQSEAGGGRCGEDTGEGDPGERTLRGGGWGRTLGRGKRWGRTQGRTLGEDSGEELRRTESAPSSQASGGAQIPPPGRGCCHRHLVLAA